MSSGPDETTFLLGCSTPKARKEALGELFRRHRARLRRMVDLRLDRRIRGREDPSDVIQDAFVEASERLEEYVKNPEMPVFLWIRFLTGQRVLLLHRKHLGVKGRDARLEVSIEREPMPPATSEALAERLLAQGPSPSEAALLAERIALLERAIDTLEPIDREVLALLHFEQLSNAEAAGVLGIMEPALRKRHARAMTRLKTAFKTLPGGLGMELP